MVRMICLLPAPTRIEQGLIQWGVKYSKCPNPVTGQQLMAGMNDAICLQLKYCEDIQWPDGLNMNVEITPGLFNTRIDILQFQIKLYYVMLTM